MSGPLTSVGAVPTGTFAPLHTRRATVPWEHTLVAAAGRLRRLGETFVLQCADPPLEVIAVGRLLAAPADRPTGLPGARLSGPDGLTEIEQALARVVVPEQADDLETALFGFMSYEAGWDLDRMGYRRPRLIPDHLFVLPRVLVRRDGAHLSIAARADRPEQAEQALQQVLDGLRRPGRDAGPPPVTAAPMFTQDRAEFRRAARVAHRHILDGEVFQLVLSLGCVFPVRRSDPVGLPAHLPEWPVRFGYQGPTFGAAGGSPEPFLLVDGRACRVRPVTGAVTCGAGEAGETAARGLLSGSDAEAAKHRMVVDQVRNDLGRVCRPGSIEVTGMAAVRRYADLLHLAAEVTGTLDTDRTAADAIRACFPASTVTGSPKTRARQLIHQLDRGSRGLYGGVVGLVSTRRTVLYQASFAAVMTPGRVHLRAGTAVLHDCDPYDVYDRCRQNLRPIAAALGAVV